MKEYESTWINDMQRYDTLGEKDKNKAKAKTKQENKINDVDEIEDLK